MHKYYVRSFTKTITGKAIITAESVADAESYCQTNQEEMTTIENKVVSIVWDDDTAVKE